MKIGFLEKLCNPDRSRHIEELERQRARLVQYKKNARAAMRTLQARYMLTKCELAVRKFELARLNGTAPLKAKSIILDSRHRELLSPLMQEGEDDKVESNNRS